jgi:hypothetical protein
MERAKAWPVSTIDLEAPVSALLWVDVPSIDWQRVFLMLDVLIPGSFRLCAKRCVAKKVECLEKRIRCGNFHGNGTIAVELLATADADAPALLSAAVIYQPRKSAFVFGLCVNAHDAAPTSASYNIAAGATAFQQRLPGLDAQCIAAVWLLKDILNEAGRSGSEVCTLTFEQALDATLLDTIAAFSTDVMSRAVSRPVTAPPRTSTARVGAQQQQPPCG